MQKIQNYIISVYDKALCLRTEGINYEPERVLRHQPKKQRSSQNANHDCPNGDKNKCEIAGHKNKKPWLSRRWWKRTRSSRPQEQKAMTVYAEKDNHTRLKLKINMQKIQNYIISVYDKALCLRTEGINYEPERVLRHQPKKQRSSQNANHDCPNGDKNKCEIAGHKNKKPWLSRRWWKRTRNSRPQEQKAMTVQKVMKTNVQ